MSQLQSGRTERLDLATALEHARQREWWRTFSWLSAAVLAAVAVAVVIADAVVTGVVVAFGLAMMVWSLRLTWGVSAALRDLRKAATAPRRAHVVVLHDVNPRAIRPLLGLWSSRPATGQRLPKADRVFRCDDELDALKSFQGDVRVHEAWVDTGPRASSKPRWIAADDGIAVVHRRALLGRWYLSMLTRHDRPGPPRPLTIGADVPPTLPTVERARLEEGLLNEVGWRFILLVLIAALAWWIA